MKKQIFISGLNLNSGTNFFITGEGENLNNFDKNCSNFFQTNVKKKEINNEDNFIICLGALKIIVDGWETEAIPETFPKSARKLGFFTKFFKNLS